MPPHEITPEEKNALPQIRTFSGDLAKAVREKGGSIVRIAIAEEEKHEKELENASASTKKNITLMVVGGVIVLTAIGIVVGTFLYKKNATATPVQTAATIPSIISADETKTIDTSGMQLADMLSAITTEAAIPNINQGTIKNIVLTQGQTVLTTKQFLTALHAHTTQDFENALSSNYMLGTYRYTANSPFLVLEGTAHDFLLAGMIAWEPYLLSDLAPLFNIDTSGIQTQYSYAKMTDAIVENRDARAVLDASGTPVIFYSFLDPNTIIIATDPKALGEAVLRF